MDIILLLFLCDLLHKKSLLALELHQAHRQTLLETLQGILTHRYATLQLAYLASPINRMVNPKAVG
jgi:hypothetical protein